MATETAPWETASEAKGSAGSDYVKMKDLVGELVLIKPTEYQDEVPSNYPNPNREGRKVQDRVVADVTVVDTRNPAKSVTHEGVWINYGRIIRVTKDKVGQGMVLGRLVTEKLSTGNEAYDLADPSPEDHQAALAAYQASQEPPF